MVSPKRLIVPAYAVGVLGAFLQLAGVNFDLTFHQLGLVDTFFTPAHTVLYSGILLGLFVAILGQLIRWRIGDDELLRPVLRGLQIIVVAGISLAVAGPFDFWWHSTYGFDVSLFTPAHSLLTLGEGLCSIGAAVGSVRLLQARNNNIDIGSSVPTKVLQLMVIVSLATMWLAFNFILMVVFDGFGIGYTFHICAPRYEYGVIDCSFVQWYRGVTFIPEILLYSASGTLVLFTAKRVLGWRGAALAVAVPFVAVNAVFDLGLAAYVNVATHADNFLIPGGLDAITSVIGTYVALLIPVAIFDLLVTNKQRIVALFASVIVGPLSLFLEPRFVLLSGLWGIDTLTTPTYLTAILLGGFIAGILRVKFANALLPHR